MDRDATVPSRARCEVEEDGRIARGVGEHLRDDVGSHVAEAPLRVRPNGFVRVPSQMKVEPREDRAREGQGSARCGRAEGERCGAGEDPLHDRGHRKPSGSAHARPPQASTR